MNFLSLFVLIPVLMLGGLLLASDIKQIRAVCATGASLLLLLAVALTVLFLGERNSGNTAEMLFTASSVWYAPFHIHYSVGVDGISVAYVIIIFHYRIHRHIHFVEDGTLAPGILYVVLSVEYRCLRFFHLHRPLHHVYVL